MLFLSGDELIWRFSSDSSINGWGWRFTAFPLMPSFGLNELLSDRTILSRPSMAVVISLLDGPLEIEGSEKAAHLAVRLVVALSACAQVSSLAASERMWALQKLRKLLKTLPLLRKEEGGGDGLGVGSCSVDSSLRASTSLSGVGTALDFSSSIASSSFLALKGLGGLPELLLRQYDYEEPIVRSSKHLMFSSFCKVGFNFAHPGSILCTGHVTFIF